MQLQLKRQSSPAPAGSSCHTREHPATLKGTIWTRTGARFTFQGVGGGRVILDAPQQVSGRRRWR
jgi:hypothetical protein